MKYASGVLNRICDRYLMEERQQDEDDWKEFMELFGEEDNAEDGILDIDNEDIFEEDDKKERWKHIRINWNYHVSQLLHELFPNKNIE